MMHDELFSLLPSEVYTALDANGHLNASPCEDQLKGERCAERIGIGTLVRDNPHSLCRGKQLQ